MNLEDIMLSEINQIKKANTALYWSVFPLLDTTPDTYNLIKERFYLSHSFRGFNNPIHGRQASWQHHTEGGMM